MGLSGYCADPLQYLVGQYSQEYYYYYYQDPRA